MKKLFLHGALGKRFGKEWSLDVSSPYEAVSALFANNPEISKYIQQKAQEGISYGIKKGRGKEFLTKEEYELKTDKNLHVFPLPEGAADFGISLAISAITTAASMYIQKKMAEAMRRDDSTLVAQTQSFIYSGGDNRYQQGSTIPLGYGKMKIGTNVISSSVTNFDYDSDSNSIINKDANVYSLIPSYYKPEEVYFNELGPLASSYLNKFFDKNEGFRVTSTNYQLIKSILPSIVFGSNDGVYGTFVNRDTQLANTTTIREGNAAGGYYYYEYNYSKGITSQLDNFQAGNWRPDPRTSGGHFDYSVNEENAIKSAYICLQSVPRLSTSKSEKIFYPIAFNESGPIQVGERWIGGQKENGLGWHKLESVSVYKAIDLLCEGQVDGFCNKDGKKLQFKRDVELDANSLRNQDDDYLQAVFLDDSPVKEVNYKKQEDSYNISEFDIDISTNQKEEIGVEDQRPLEDKYLFTYNIKEINQQLFGPKSIEQKTILYNQGINEFVQKKIFSKNEFISYEESIYRVNLNLSNNFDQNENYQSQINGEDLIVYTGQEDDAKFYLAQSEIDEYQEFDYDTQYEDGDKIKSRLVDGSTEYYTLGSDADKYLGAYTEDEDYSEKINYIVHKKKVLYKIASVEDPAEGDPAWTLLIIKASALDDNGEEIGAYDSPIYTILNTDDPDIQGLDFATVKNIEPSVATEIWKEIIIKSPNDITDSADQKLYLNVFVLSGEEGAEEEFDPAEENYISHTIINPLVEQAYISLNIDELSYVYEGDNIEVTYKIGELFKVLLGGLTVFYAASAAISASKAATEASKAKNAINSAEHIKQAADHSADASESLLMTGVLGTMTAVILSSDEWKIGTKIENSGELWPNKARFRIKYGNENETMYSTDIFLYGIATSAYRKDVKIYLPPNPEQKDRIIKVYKLNRERNLIKEGEQSARYKERFSLGSITEISPAVMSYPNSVIVGTRINARDYRQMPTRNFHLRLKKVAVPSNYNPETRKYSGNWSGLFKGQNNKNDTVAESSKQWTDNPAWCLYDLISNKRYGVGKFGIKYNHIDRWTLYKMAKYCDEFIPTGYSPKYEKRKFEVYGEKVIKITSPEVADPWVFRNEFNYINKKLAIFYEDGTYESIGIENVDIADGVIYLNADPDQTEGMCAVEIDYPIVEPRYTMNAFIMDQQNAFKLINEFASIFRAFAYWSGGAINFFQDEKRESVMLFTNNNISEQGFSYSSTPKTSRTNSCKIKYLDRYNMYRPKIEYSENKEAIKDNNIIEQTIDGFGITSQAQAKRAADFVVKTANLETELISFSTSSIGSYLKPGDIVDVLDQKRNLGKFSGKILNFKISEDGETAELDVDYPIRTIIDPNNKDTWKKITLYLPQKSESISSLDASEDVTDEKISGIREPQIKEYLVSEITNNDTKLILKGHAYSYIDGNYKWSEALRDAEQRGGFLANIENEKDQEFINSVLPKDKSAWVSGMKRRDPEGGRVFVWANTQNCHLLDLKFIESESEEKIEQENNNYAILNENSKKLFYENWADQEPKVWETYIYIQGSEGADHGKWYSENNDHEIGYIINEPDKNNLFDLRDSKGMTFVMEDNVHFANKKQYKILSIEESGQGTFTVQGLQYNKEKFDNIEKDLSIKAPESPVIFTERPLDPPSNVTLQILKEDVSKDIPYGLRVRWDEVAGANSYRIQFFNGNIMLASFELLSSNLPTMSHDFRDPRITENGSYYARIYARSQ